MNVLKTAFAAYKELWIIIALAVVTLAVLNLVIGGTSGFGGRLVIYAMIVFFAHQTILTGGFAWTKKKDDPAPSPIQLKFFGLLLAIAILPMVIGVIIGMSAFGGQTDNGIFAGLLLGLAFTFLALVIFGLKLPLFVWNLLFPNDTLAAATAKSQKGFIAIHLVVLNGGWFLILLGLAIAVQNLVPHTILTIPAVTVLDGIIFDVLGYMYVTLTAATLTHAHLRAHDLPPQGLIREL